MNSIRLYIAVNRETDELFKGVNGDYTYKTIPGLKNAIHRIITCRLVETP